MGATGRAEERDALSGWSKAKSALDTASVFPAGGCMTCAERLATGLQRLGVRLEVTEAGAESSEGKSGRCSRNLSKARLGRGETR
jgi:hypothetical protein